MMVIKMIIYLSCPVHCMLASLELQVTSLIVIINLPVLFFSTETLPAYKDSFFVGFAPSPPSPAPVTPSGKPSPGKESNKNSGVSKGATAGIAIVMLVVGIAGGLVIAHFIMKRRGSGLFAYQRHE